MEKLQWIQILRAVAACSVVLHHALNYAIMRNMMAGDPNGSIFEAGVDLFFVISGFVMMMMTDPARAANLSPVWFLRNRFIRIVPMYWFYTFVLVAACFIAPTLFRTTVLNGDVLWYSLLLIPFRDAEALAPVLRVGWTLVYEAWFYVLVAATLQLSLWWRAGVVATVFAIAVGVANYAGLEGEAGRYLANTMIFEFLAGMLIYTGYQRFAKLPVGVPAALILVGLAWLAASTAIGRPTLPSRFALWGIPAAMIMIGALRLPNVKGSLGRALAILGDASYSIYLSHLFTIGAVYWAMDRFDIMQPWTFIVAALVCSVALGVLSYRMLERPMLRWARPSPRAGSQPA